MSMPMCWPALSLRIRKGARMQLLQLIRNRSFLVAPRQQLSVTSDPDDNIFIECADCRPRGLLDYGQSQALSPILEGNQDHFAT